MIRKVKNKDIDFSKYQQCIESSVQRNFYAKKDILNALCEDWELLVYGDYEFVMPIPIRKKLGLKIVVMPLFCQQLGIFGFEKNNQVEEEFLNYFQKNYRILFYSFNAHNSFSEDFNTKKNYFIPKTEYSFLRKSYFKGRKSTVKTAQYLDFKEVELSGVSDFIRNNFKGLEKEKDLDKLFEYLHFLNEEKKLELCGSFKEDHLTNVAILINDDGSFALLGLVNDEKYKQDNGASFLIDRILKDHIQDKSFNFMGGTIRGLEVFFKSFGAELQEYAIIERSKKDLIKNFLKK